MLDQVFIDSPAGNFDSVTTNIFGCSSASSCGSLIAFQTKTSPASFRSAYAVNRSGTGVDLIQVTDLGLTGNYTNVTTANFARFTLPSASVPEPASWAMILAGFGLLGAALRRGKTIVRFA